MVYGIGQFVHFSLVEDSLVNTLNGFVQEVCPVSRPMKKESEQKRIEKAASGGTSAEA